MKTLLRLFIMTLFIGGCLVLAASAYAQQGPPPPPPGGQRGEGGPPRPPREGPDDGAFLDLDAGDRPAPNEIDVLGDNDGKELLETLRIARISQQLNLNDEETVLMLRRFKEFREKGMTLHRERQAIARDLKNLVKGDGKEDDVSQKLNALIAKDDELSSLKKQAYEKIAEGLSSAQRAKLYVAMTEFEGEIKRMIQQVRQRRGFGDEGPREWRHGQGPGFGPQQPGAGPQGPGFGPPQRGGFGGGGRSGPPQPQGPDGGGFGGNPPPPPRGGPGGGQPQ